MSRGRALAAGLALVVAVGCGSEKRERAAPPADDRPPPITVPEKSRNADACLDYVTRACACAAAHPDQPDVGEMCKYDKALPDALGLAMTTAENPASNRTDVLLSQQQARKIAAQCIEQLAKLPALGCE